MEKAPLSIKIAFKKRRELFLQDVYHPLLNNHALTGSLQRYRSINVTGDWRALFRIIETVNGVICYFDTLGTHSQLYKK